MERHYNEREMAWTVGRKFAVVVYALYMEYIVLCHIVGIICVIHSGVSYCRYYMCDA